MKYFLAQQNGLYGNVVEKKKTIEGSLIEINHHKYRFRFKFSTILAYLSNLPYSASLLLLLRLHSIYPPGHPVKSMQAKLKVLWSIYKDYQQEKNPVCATKDKVSNKNNLVIEQPPWYQINSRFTSRCSFRVRRRHTQTSVTYQGTNQNTKRIFHALPVSDLIGS